MEMTYDWIVFSSKEFKKEIRNYSPTSEFHYKIIPTKFSYNAVMKLLEKDFDNLTSSDIIRLDD